MILTCPVRRIPCGSRQRPSSVSPSWARHAPAGTQVIVVDDGSPAATASAVARKFGAEAVRFPVRRGFCAAANAGIRAAQGEVVELLNDDTEVTAGWAEAALSAFRDSTVAAVAPLVLAWPGDRIDSAGDRYYLGGVAGKRGHDLPVTADYLQPCPVFGVSAAAGFYRRAALERVGLFPESFGAYFEDVDLSFRLHRAGYQVRFEPAARVLHRGGASHGRVARRLLEQQSRNEERVFWRNVPVLWRAVPHHLAVLAGKAWRRWTEGKLTPFVCGRLRVLGEIGELRRHRDRLSRLGPAEEVDRWQVEAAYWGR